MEVGYLGCRGDPFRLNRKLFVCFRSLPVSPFFFSIHCAPHPHRVSSPSLHGGLELLILLPAPLKDQSSSDYLSKQWGKGLLWPLRWTALPHIPLQNPFAALSFLGEVTQLRLAAQGGALP